MNQSIYGFFRRGSNNCSGKDQVKKGAKRKMAQRPSPARAQEQGQWGLMVVVLPVLALVIIIEILKVPVVVKII